MGIFKKKKKDFVDFTGQKYSESSGRDDVKSASAQENSSEMFGIFGNANVASTAKSSNSSEYADFSNTENQNYSGNSEDADEKRKKLAKRLSDMTDKLEEISNQIYHLQQRIEVLERKTDSRSY